MPLADHPANRKNLMLCFIIDFRPASTYTFIQMLSRFLYPSPWNWELLYYKFVMSICLQPRNAWFRLAEFSESFLLLYYTKKKKKKDLNSSIRFIVYTFMVLNFSAMFHENASGAVQELCEWSFYFIWLKHKFILWWKCSRSYLLGPKR